MISQLRTSFFLLIPLLFISLSSCGPRQMHIKVEVQDIFTGENLDSVKVDVLRAAKGGAAQILQSCYTSTEGNCSLLLEVDEQYAYQVQASRAHYKEALSEDGSDYLHQAKLEISDSTEVQLFLENILPPDPERFEKMYPVVPISQVIAAISADEWSWSFLPKISWEDVPILLNQGADSTFIKNYPRNLRSTYRPDSIRAGLVALWLVEALRKQELKSNDDYFNLSPPSRAPVLGTRRGNPSGFNSVEQIQAAQEAYNIWWEEVPADSAARMDAIRKNPLAGKGLSWM
ncbi:MAG: DUF4943 family protein [Bacteroidia bacterium]|nr:DUF4943 family protein [Bacteroidia bacterium]